MDTNPSQPEDWGRGDRVLHRGVGGFDRDLCKDFCFHPVARKPGDCAVEKLELCDLRIGDHQRPPDPQAGGLVANFPYRPRSHLDR